MHVETRTKVMIKVVIALRDLHQLSQSWRETFSTTIHFAKQTRGCGLKVQLALCHAFGAN